MVKATIEEVKDEKGKSTFRLMLGGREIGTSKTDSDARFHMHAINLAIDMAFEEGKFNRYCGDIEVQK